MFALLVLQYRLDSNHHVKCQRLRAQQTDWYVTVYDNHNIEIAKSGNVTRTLSVTMDYKPRYPQPFTLAEATALDLSVISEGRVVTPNLKGNAIGS